MINPWHRELRALCWRVFYVIFLPRPIHTCSPRKQLELENAWWQYDNASNKSMVIYSILHNIFTRNCFVLFLLMMIFTEFVWYLIIRVVNILVAQRFFGNTKVNWCSIIGFNHGWCDVQYIARGPMQRQNPTKSFVVPEARWLCIAHITPSMIKSFYSTTI